MRLFPLVVAGPLDLFLVTDALLFLLAVLEEAAAFERLKLDVVVEALAALLELSIGGG